MYKSIAAPVTIPKVYGKISDGTDSTLHSIEEGDAIIIGSDDVSKKSAELAAKVLLY